MIILSILIAYFFIVWLIGKILGSWSDKEDELEKMLKSRAEHERDK